MTSTTCYCNCVTDFIMHVSDPNNSDIHNYTSRSRDEKTIMMQLFMQLCINGDCGKKFYSRVNPTTSEYYLECYPRDASEIFE